MGLDMYLFRRSQEPEYDEDGERTLGERVYYWRKANQIRGWLVKNAGYPADANCEPFELTEDILTDLMNDCIEVIIHPEKAAELIPPTNGFFFGDTDLDEWYFDELKATSEILEEILGTTDFTRDEIIYYEWW